MNMCSVCQRPIGSCSWERSFKPVDGWSAKKVARRFQTTIGGKTHVTTVESYEIHDCPLYQPPGAGRLKDQETSPKKKPRAVIAEDMVFHTKVRFSSVAAAEKDGGFVRQEIAACLEGRQQSHYGHYFYYEGDD